MILFTKYFADVQDEKAHTPDQVSLAIRTGAGTTIQVQITLEEKPLAALEDSIWKPELIFGDNGGSDDTITRNKGSWIADGFAVGQLLTITNTVSNNVIDVAVTAVTEKVLSVTTGSFADETVAEGNTVTIDGSIPDADWLVYDTVAAASDYFTTFEYGPTAIRLFRASGSATCKAWLRG